MREDLIIGVIASLLATLITVIFTVLAIWILMKVMPGFRLLVRSFGRLSQLPLSGRYLASFKSEAGSYCFELYTIRRFFNLVWGDLIYIDDGTEKRYSFVGTIKNNILNGQFRNDYGNRSDTGSFSLRLVDRSETDDALFFVGKVIWVDDDTSKQLATDYVLERRAGIQVRGSASHGYGVFAVNKYLKGDVLFRFRGTETSTRTKYSIQKIGSEEVHLEPVTFGHFLNHSCQPNAKLRLTRDDGLEVVATKAINVSEEICVNYLDTESKLLHPFDCKCAASEHIV